MEIKEQASVKISKLQGGIFAVDGELAKSFGEAVELVRKKLSVQRVPRKGKKTDGGG